MTKVKKNNTSKKLHIILLILFVLCSIISAIKPHDYSSWFFEFLPAFIGIIILVFTYNKFVFTDFVYVLILIVTIIMLIGAHYKYSNVPLFNLTKQVYNLRRNNYDRFGHFMQGFVPAFIVRELLIRKVKLKKGIVLSIIVVCICLSISSFYEILEGLSSIVYGMNPEKFLEYQGDKLDTQWDMFCALTGAVVSVTMFHKVHDKNIYNLEKCKE
ncbi:DUF2238 domain-containing protein [Clostridium sp. P21]|uniref:DUF2238 domain-containing protein n=1 Tax=Clostridium muellerianum TaxID=2716538 RepID=A0A7Y0EFD3_9CLOT|nr:DUF2238 domain-containing protein [Clostridium muellerianum]NMM62469.1 DUF2238 domain-containing protein [Clostridium muellerianum]